MSSSLNTCIAQKVGKISSLALMLALAACSSRTPVSNEQGSTAPGAPVDVVGEGQTFTGWMFEDAYDSSTGACSAATKVHVLAGESLADEPTIRLGGIFSEGGGTVMLPTENDAPGWSRITLDDGRNGVVVDGTMTFTWGSSADLSISISGASWCELDAAGSISTCSPEAINTDFDVSFLEASSQPGCAVEADPNLVTSQGLCIAGLSPPRCVGDPTPPQQD